MIDLSGVTKLSLNWNHSTTSNPIRSDCLIDLFKRTPDVQSLAVDPIVDDMILSDAEKNFHSMIIRYVDPSKLRYLQIPITDIDQIQRLLNQFRNLHGIRLLQRFGLISIEEMIAYLRALMPGCSIWRDGSSVSFWMDQRMETTNARKRRKLSHPVETM